MMAKPTESFNHTYMKCYIFDDHYVRNEGSCCGSNYIHLPMSDRMWTVPARHYAHRAKKTWIHVHDAQFYEESFISRASNEKLLISQMAVNSTIFKMGDTKNWSHVTLWHYCPNHVMTPTNGGWWLPDPQSPIKLGLGINQTELD